MKHILEAQVVNKYRSHTPFGFYNLIKGHTGVDLGFYFEELPSPVSGKISHIASGNGDLPKQKEMGNVIYLDDLENGNIHVFAHMDRIDVKVGDHIQRNQILGRTGNTGERSTSAHLHWEVITFKKPSKTNPVPYDALFNFLMVRSLEGFNGWNIDPLAYLRILYSKYRLNSQGEVAPLTKLV